MFYLLFRDILKKPKLTNKIVTLLNFPLKNMCMQTFNYGNFKIKIFKTKCCSIKRK